RIQGRAPNPKIWYTFSAFIYLAVVAMAVLACVTTPLYQWQYFNEHPHQSTRFNWFTFTDMGFAALFTVEAIIKIIADGFWWTPNAFFRSSWGFIDGVVLVTLWVNVITSLYDPGSGSRAVGAFKALRALRLLNVSDSARDTFHSVIILGGWKVISAAFVSLSLLVPFAIYGVNLFAGQMQSCNDGSGAVVNLTDCVGEYMASPYNWEFPAPRQVGNS
ncbi:calcium channel-like protein subunit Cch1, partial [Hortaea werneckii]